MSFALLVVALLAPTVTQPAVRVVGPKSVTLTAAEIAAMPRVTVKATSHGKESTYEGASMREILTRAGVPASADLRGADVGTVVIVTGADGYRAAFGIAEFDPGFTDRVSILADRQDGTPLAAEEAPFQLILTGEKRAARCVRQVTTIEIHARKRADGSTRSDGSGYTWCFQTVVFSSSCGSGGTGRRASLRS